MSSVITWRIINLEWIEAVGDNDKVVTNVHYWVDVTNGSSMGYTWGNVQLNIDDLNNFNDFDSLTEQQCIQWVKDELNRLYDGDGVTLSENAATQMMNENDPMRTRGFGVPW